MIDMITTIGDFFGSVGGAIAHSLEEVVFVMSALGRSIQLLPTYIGYILPTTIVALLATAFSVVLILRVSGKT